MDTNSLSGNVPKYSFLNLHIAIFFRSSQVLKERLMENRVCGCFVVSKLNGFRSIFYFMLHEPIIVFYSEEAFLEDNFIMEYDSMLADLVVLLKKNSTQVSDQIEINF